jgi:hypothetical protein
MSLFMLRLTQLLKLFPDSGIALFSPFFNGVFPVLAGNGVIECSEAEGCISVRKGVGDVR